MTFVTEITCPDHCDIKLGAISFIKVRLFMILQRRRNVFHIVVDSAYSILFLVSPIRVLTEMKSAMHKASWQTLSLTVFCKKNSFIRNWIWFYVNLLSVYRFCEFQLPCWVTRMQSVWSFGLYYLVFRFLRYIWLHTKVRKWRTQNSSND